VGLAFYAQDAQNCYLFRAWTPAEGETSGNAELVCVLAGEQTVLATGECRVFPGAWSELSVRTHDGKITCLVDDQSVLSAEDDTFAEGRVGLCTQSCEKAAFDDAALEVYREFSDDFEPEAALPIDTVAGEFIVKDGRLLASPDGGQGLAVTGGEQWEDYAVSADITPLGAQAVGLVAGRLSNGTRLLFRWRAGKTPGDPGVQELWDCRPTGRKLLGSRNAELTEGATYHAELMLDRGYARVSVDGQTALEAVVAGRPGAGAVGLQVEGQRQAAFDNLSVRFCDPEKEPVSITDQFSKEDTMANWARPISSWQSIGEDWYTYELPVWGDFSIRMPLAKLGSGAAPWSVEVKAAVSPEALAGTSSAAVLTAEAGRTDLLCTTTGEPLALTSEAEAPQLELQRRGGCLLVSLDGRAMAGGPIAPAPDASVVAVRLKGNAYPLTQATLTSPNIIDETFSSAPTDWTPSAGRWDISDRWNCSPQWSWFCGRDAETPLLWYKWPFTGDLVFEYWGGMMMDLTEAPHYSHPSDLNSVICGDGQNLCSGYGLVFAGDNNTIGRILRKGEAAAVSNEFKWDKPVGANTRFHNMWFHSRVEKLGAHLSYTVDGRAALQYDDPDPLPGGHVGVWTHQKNGILVARARIAFRD